MRISDWSSDVCSSDLAVKDVIPFETLLEEVHGCNVCADVLPLGARPIFQLSPTATILVASQAPGTKAHGSGIPFDDPSGDRLREWMGFSKEEFYDASKVAILPIGLCYRSEEHTSELQSLM